MHKTHREKLVSMFQTDDVPEKGIIFMEGGKSSERANSDAEEYFRQESFFFYLLGVKEPDCLATIEARTGVTTLYIPRPSEGHIIVMGDIGSLEFWQEKYHVDNVKFVDECEATLQEYGPQLVYILRGKNTDAGTFTEPPSFPGLGSFEQNDSKLYNAITECRIIKTDAEIRLLKWLNNLSSDAHIECMQQAFPGMGEFQFESIFRHFCYFKGGSRLCAYTPIAASGPNCAVLHYGHAGAPNDRITNDGDFLLFDFGAEFHCYASDITNSFPINGKFTEDQKIIFNLVKTAQFNVMDQMKPG
ncbi:MAG: aminopeptidase P N-terminal domain-containing protein, partial [Bacteroidota bacterium]